MSGTTHVRTFEMAHEAKSRPAGVRFPLFTLGVKGKRPSAEVSWHPGGVWVAAGDGAFHLFADEFRWLLDNPSALPDQFGMMLVNRGWEDITKRGDVEVPF